MRLLPRFASSLLLLATVSGASAQSPKRSVGSVGDTIDAVVQAEAAGKLWGLVYAIKKGKPVYLWVRGKNHADDAPIGADSYFDFGDTSRIFTGVAVLRLVAKRKLDLEATLATLLADIEGGVPEDKGDITLLQLLQHTAGLAQGVVFAPEMHASGEKTVAQILKSPVEFPAGARQQRSPANDQVLAWILEQASGKSFEHTIRREVFDRARMKSTGFRGEAKFDADRQTSRIQNRRSKPVTDAPWNWVIHGWAGVVSTPEDMARFALALDGTRLLTKKFASVLLQPPSQGSLACGITPETAPNLQTVYRNATNMDGVSTELSWIPDQDLVLVLCGRDGAPLPELGTALRAALCPPVAAEAGRNNAREPRGAGKAERDGLPAFAVDGVWRLPGGEHVDVQMAAENRVVLTALGPLTGHLFVHGSIPDSAKSEELRQLAMTSDTIMATAIRAALAGDDPAFDGPAQYRTLFARGTLERAVRSSFAALERTNQAPGPLVTWELEGIDLQSKPRRAAYALRSAPDETIRHWVVKLVDAPPPHGRGAWTGASLESTSPFVLNLSASDSPGAGGLQTFSGSANGTPVELGVLPAKGRTPPQLAMRIGSGNPLQFIPVRTGR